MAYVGTYRALLAGGVARPALVLDFIRLNVLDPRITFSRGSNATLTDSTGKITYAPANLLTYSQEFDNAAWGQSQVTVAANATVAPDGTSTADKVVESTANSLHTVIRNITTVAAPYTWSCYIKAAERTFAFLYHVESNAGVSINLLTGATGTPSGTVAPTASTVTSVGNGWYRLTMTATATAALNSFRIYVATSLTSTVYTGDGTSGIFIWGAQLEPVTYQTTPSTYQATTSSAYYGPRFDYDPVTLAAKGLLVEEQRTNLLTYSEQFDNAAWADAAPGSTVTVAADNTTAPDGTTTADKLTAATGGTNGMARQVKTLVASTAYTGSVFLKASNSTQSRMLLRDTTAGTNFADATITWTAGVPSIAGGATGTWSVTSFGNGWYRVTGTGTTGATASPAVTFSLWPDTASGTNAIFAWGAQLEAGAFATSYIPTVASTVTRSADVATMTGANFSAWYNQAQGSFVVAVSLNNTPATATFSLYSVSDNSVNERIFIGTGSGSGGNINTIITDGGVLQAQTINGSLASAGVYKYANAYALNDFSSVANGGTAATDTSGTLPTPDRLYIGLSAVGTAPINGHIRTLAYYNTRLPNSTLVSLTS